jgi:hypothetical protein
MRGIFKQDWSALANETDDAVEAWEGEGGLSSQAGGCMDPAGRKMTGTESQVEWADQIKTRVAAEFDRVAKAFHRVAGKQREQDRIETLAVIAILEEKRAEVMANDRAGYFIREWQELSGRVQQMIAQDVRYQAIKASREARRRRTIDSLSASTGQGC